MVSMNKPTQAKAKWQRVLLMILSIVCMAAVLFCGVSYLNSLRADLREQAIRNVMTVTEQQRQAVDNFISADRERLHSYAEYFSTNFESLDDIQVQLTIFNDVDATFGVFCLDEGRLVNNRSEKTIILEGDTLDEYRAFTGAGVRDSYIGLLTGVPKFGYYETFVFPNGHRGMIQKSYDRSKILETFSLSFYDNEGLAYIVSRDGDVIIRSQGLMGDHVYDNVFDILTGTESQQGDIGRFREALDTHESGSLNFSGLTGSYVYTYVPLTSVDGWYLVSVVRESAIMENENQIIMNSNRVMILLAVLLVTFVVLLLMIIRFQKDIGESQNMAEYQSQMLDVLSDYFVRNTGDAYLILDTQSQRMEYVSPNAAHVLAVAPDRWTDTMELFSKIERDLNIGPFREIAPDVAPKSRELECVIPGTEERRWFLVTVYPTSLMGENKVVLYFSDRTQARREQDRLAEALRMAQVANKAKTTFLSNVSHDIRTPMNAIIGFISLMRDEADNPAVVLEYTQRIDAASQQLLALINDVLDMNKIESGGTSLVIAETHLSDIIDEINTIIRPQAKAKEQTFKIYVSNLTYDCFQADKLRINQVLINLLSNAVKYTPRGGMIELRVEELSQVVEDYSRIRFTVKDNGMGMSEEYLKIIWDPFTREESEVVHGIQGTGLGMAITKSLVDLMGGTISVESELEHGSTFVVELELKIMEKITDPKFWSDCKISKMIVADDDEDVCKGIVKAMSGTGVRVNYATDGLSAIRKLREARESGKPYDLILLDWKMPDLDGVETARLIRKSCSNKVPILLLTAYDWSEIAEEASEVGVEHFMPKPFFINTFKDAIRRIIGKREQAEDTRNDLLRDKHVLVVDDIEVNRIILTKILSTLGAHCDTAGDGKEALDAFLASQPGEFDLIMMDVQMPVMDGYAATRAIRASGHPSAGSVPIIAMTANAFVDDIRDAINAGMDAHVAKPVQIDKLKETIQAIFDNRKSNASQ